MNHESDRAALDEVVSAGELLDLGEIEETLEYLAGDDTETGVVEAGRGVRLIA